MTLKYESEILFDLMKRDGDNAPSDVLPYESELKEKYLQQVVGAYPKLQDYRAEWLNYNLDMHLPAVFPVVTLSNVTKATVDNVVPYAYKSAILKGQTLVNLCNVKDDVTFQSAYNGNTANRMTQFMSLQNTILQPNTKYLVRFKITNYINESNLTIPLTSTDYHISSNTININGNGYYNIIATTMSDMSNYGGMLVVKGGATAFDNNTTSNISFMISEKMVIEYQDGMENWDIPYFEGIQSVKMPVLTTSNEDGTKTNILTVNEEVELRGIGDVKDEVNLLTGELTQRIGEVVLDGSEVWSFEVNGSLSSTNRFYTEKVVVGDAKSSPSNTLNDVGLVDLPVGTSINDNEHICIVAGKIYIRKNKTECSDLSAFENWLSSNPITLQYELATKSVKTVDLTVIDQDGNTLSRIKPIEGTMHLSTSGTPIKPSFKGEIPVEATKQNLASFIGE